MQYPTNTRLSHARTLSDKELELALNHAASTRHAERNCMAILLSHYAGLRVAEIAGLKIGDIRNSDGSIKQQVKLSKDITKGRVPRDVYFNDMLRTQLAYYVTNATNNNHPLIPSQKNGAFTPNSLCKLFTSLYSAIGLDGATSHSGRRSFISKLHHSGVAAKTIMELAGHKNLSTVQRYIDSTDQMKIDAVELLMEG